MRFFLTRDEACDVLREVNAMGCLTREQAKKLASISVCIAADSAGLNLWGESVDEAKVLFRDCEQPGEGASPAMVKNYEAYKLCAKQAQKKFEN